MLFKNSKLLFQSQSTYCSDNQRIWFSSSSSNKMLINSRNDEMIKAWNSHETQQRIAFNPAERFKSIESELFYLGSIISRSATKIFSNSYASMISRQFYILAIVQNRISCLAVILRVFDEDGGDNDARTAENWNLKLFALRRCCAAVWFLAVCFAGCKQLDSRRE